MSFPQNEVLNFFSSSLENIFQMEPLSMSCHAELAAS